MPTHCAVQGCSSKSFDSHLQRRFISIPSGESCSTEGSLESRRLSQLQRKTWLERIHRKESEVTKNTKICHMHFVTGKTTSLWEVDNPDWAPSLHLSRGTPRNKEKVNRKTEEIQEHREWSRIQQTGLGPFLESTEPLTHYNHDSFGAEEPLNIIRMGPSMFFQDKNEGSETMSTYRLHWPGLSTLKVYIANPQTDELYGPDNPLPMRLEHLNIIENKYIGIQSLMSRFGSEKSQQMAKATLSSMLSIQGMKPLLVKNTKMYLHLSCLLAFITVFPYCASFQKCKGVLLHFLMNYMETICSNCGFIHRDCVCKSDGESSRVQTNRFYKPSTQDAETQTDSSIRLVPSVLQSSHPVQQPFKNQTLQYTPSSFSVLPQNMPAPPMYQGNYPMPNVFTSTHNEMTLIPVSPVFGLPGNNPMHHNFPLQSIVRPDIRMPQIDKPKANKKKQKSCKDVHEKTTKKKAANKSKKKGKLKKTNAKGKGKALLPITRKRIILKPNTSGEISDEKRIGTLNSNFSSEKAFKCLDIPEIKTEPFPEIKTEPISPNVKNDSPQENNQADSENRSTKEDRLGDDQDGNNAVESSLNCTEFTDNDMTVKSSEKQQQKDKKENQSSEIVISCPRSTFPVKINLPGSLKPGPKDKSNNLFSRKQIKMKDPVTKKLTSPKTGSGSPYSEDCFEYIGDVQLNSVIDIGFATYKYTPSEEEVIKCTMCKKTPVLLDTETFAKLHRKTHICWPVIQSLTCTKCAFKVVPSRWPYLLKHMHFAHDVHGYIENKKEANCFLCGLDFSSKEERDDHLLYHYFNKYSCIKCGVLKLSWKSVEQHKLLCTNAKSEPRHYGCPYCSVICKSRENRDVHVSCHKDEGLVCTVCDDDMFWKSWLCLKLHLSSAHQVATDISVFTCDKCGADFSSQNKLERHCKKKHTDLFKSCNKCSKKFKTHGMLKKHQDYAHGEKATCAICGFEAVSKKALGKHTQIEHGHKDFLCNQCGLTFTNDYVLRMHLSAHAGEKFTCEHCYKGFKKHVEYHQHKMKYHAVPSAKPVFECEHCDYRFNTKTSLKVHHKKHHPSFTSDTEVDDHCYWNKKVSPPQQDKKVVQKRKGIVHKKKKVLKKTKILETTDKLPKGVNKKYTKRQIDLMKRKAIKNVERKIQKTKVEDLDEKIKQVKKPSKNKTKLKKKKMIWGCARLKTLLDYREDRRREAEEKKVKEEEPKNKDMAIATNEDLNSSKIAAFHFDHCYFKQDSDSTKGKVYTRKVNDFKLVIVNAPDVSEFQECETYETIKTPTSVCSEDLALSSLTLISHETAKKIPEKVSILKPTSTCVRGHSIQGEVMASENEELPGEVSDLVIETCMESNTETTIDTPCAQISDTVEESTETIASSSMISNCETQFMQLDDISSSVEAGSTEMLIETIDKEVFDHSDEKESDIDTMMELDDIELKEADYQLWDKTNEDNTDSESTAEETKREGHEDIVSSMYLDHTYF